MTGYCEAQLNVFECQCCHKFFQTENRSRPDLARIPNMPMSFCNPVSVWGSERRIETVVCDGCAKHVFEAVAVVFARRAPPKP